jgi:flagellin-like hook-associated protein FlgL
LALGDIDGDGAVDIVGTAINDNLITVLRGTLTTASYQQRIRPIRDVDLSSIPTARDAVAYLSKVATDITAVQSAIASHESRITFAGELANRISELSTQSADTIRSIDTATEVANLVSNQVRAAGQSALLAQAGSLETAKISKLFSSF